MCSVLAFRVSRHTRKQGSVNSNPKPLEAESMATNSQGIGIPPSTQVVQMCFSLLGDLSEQRVGFLLVFLSSSSFSLRV